MIALEITETGDFMQKLLVKQVFDRFYLLEAEVTTFSVFRIEGELNKAYFTNDEMETIGDRAYTLWSDVKPVIYQIIKGKKLPVDFKLVLQLSDENRDWLLQKYHLGDQKEVLKGLYLNIRYQDRKLVCITGLSYKTFVMDKTLEHIWDDTAGQFMKQNSIVCEQM